MTIRMLDSRNHLLLIILHVGQHGSSYASKLSREGIAFPAIYRTLDYLEEIGILTQTLTDTGGKGSIKRLYRLTPSGERVYEHVSAIDRILKGEGDSESSA